MAGMCTCSLLILHLLFSLVICSVCVDDACQPCSSLDIEGTLNHLMVLTLPPPAGVAERSAKRIIKPERYNEGAGFPVNSPIGGRQLPQLDPFLLLHHMGPVTYGPGAAKGAPWHPHRGFVTVTYMLEGEFEHHDSTGGSGKLRAGDIQWMTAGSGIIHDEVPSAAVMQKGGTIEGFQVWVNLPRKDKMCDPDYQDVASERIPEHKSEKFLVRVIAGEAFGKKAIVATKVPVQYLDFHANEGATFSHEIPAYER